MGRRLVPLNAGRALALSGLALAGIAAAVAAWVPVVAADAPWGAILLEIQALQRDLHRQLSDALRAVRTEGPAAAQALVVLSFAYGVFHAVGPGHGKIVISTYIFTQESQLRRGLLLSVAASLCQGLTAVVAVSATIGLLQLSMRAARGAATDLETLSYGLVALVGVALMVGRGRRLWRRSASPHDHDEPAHAEPSPHGHDHGSETACGHHHGPARHDLDAPLSWRSFAAIVASVGARPCSGAVLVLLVSHALGLYWAGICAVFAMSLGTAVTVSALAVLAVYARSVSLRLAAVLPDGASRLTAVVDVVGVIGGAVIATVGALLLHVAWQTPVHPLQ